MRAGGIPKNKYNEYCWLIGEPEIGDGTWIGAFTVIDGSGGLKIGRGCEISSGVHIYTHSTVKRCVYGKKFRGDGTVNRDIIERAPVSIGDHSFVGANSTILMGVSVGDHCVVGAGSVVLEGTVIPPYSVVAGVPAKVIKRLRKIHERKKKART
jgi:acetyltransferase-like isoleucine patch superfamily enzyme